MAGSGAPDISAIDEGFIVQFRNQADKFVNLLDKGGADVRVEVPALEVEGVDVAPTARQIGLGTDVGGLAMCYRSDLFKKAGLPTDRDAVSELWPTWDDFINVGKQYVAKTGKKFVDSGTNMFNPVLAQQPVGFFDEQEQLQMDGGPKVALDVSMKAIQAGISANLASFQPNWDQGFKKDQFAVLACPAWMLGHIQDTAPDQKGKWDIAAIPGGGGNWGGSWWTIPEQGKHATRRPTSSSGWSQPEQQIEVFKTVGNLPSQPALYKDPAVLDFKKEFFSNAPDRPDLRRDRGEPEAAVPGQEERPGPGRRGERDHPGAAGQASSPTPPGRRRSRRPRRPPSPDLIEPCGGAAIGPPRPSPRSAPCRLTQIRPTPPATRHPRAADRSATGSTASTSRACPTC